MKKAEEKRKLRREILAIRNAMPLLPRQEKSDKILQKIYGIEEYKNAAVILTYVDYQSEVLTLPLIEKALFDKKQVFCPKVLGDDMDFYRIRSLEELEEGYKGIREPVTFNRFLDKEDELSTYIVNTTGKLLMIVPGVVFDNDCHRIGYGKGFYDKFMTRLSENKIDFYAVGLGYECQLIPGVPCETHDIGLDMIVTEETIYRRGM